MQCFIRGLFVMVVACGAGVVLAGPLDKNAASKANGDMVGNAPAASAPSAYRSFSYNPAPAPAPAPRVASAMPANPAPPAQAAPTAPVRRYSYQPQMAAPRYYSAWQSPRPGYLRVDKKVLGY